MSPFYGSEYDENGNAVGPLDDDAGSPESSLLVGLRTGDWLDLQKFDPISWAVPGVFPEGLSLLVGPPKVGKSWMVLSLALACASGGMALGRIRVRQRPVLYLALEDGDRRMQDRCRTLLGDDPIPAWFTYLTVVKPSELFATIDEWVQLYGPEALVMIDTLGKVKPPAAVGESAYALDYRVGGRLKEIADKHKGMSLVLVHHDRKASSEDFVDSVSGTHGLAGAADTIVLLVRKRQESNGLLRVTGRDVDESEYALDFQDAAWTLDGQDLAEAADAARERRTEEQTTGGVGDRMADVIRYVNTSNGTRAAEVAEKLGMDAKQAGVYLNRAAKENRVDRISYGIYGPVRGVKAVKDAGQEGGTGSNTSVRGVRDGGPGGDTTQDHSNTSNTPPVIRGGQSRRSEAGSNTSNTLNTTCVVCGFPCETRFDGRWQHPACDEVGA